MEKQPEKRVGERERAATPPAGLSGGLRERSSIKIAVCSPRAVPSIVFCLASAPLCPSAVRAFDPAVVASRVARPDRIRSADRFDDTAAANRVLFCVPPPPPSLASRPTDRKDRRIGDGKLRRDYRIRIEFLARPRWLKSCRVPLSPRFRTGEQPSLSRARFVFSAKFTIATPYDINVPA